MIIRQRKLKISSDHTQEHMVRINKKYEKREKNREAAALKAAQVERAIEKELLNRLKVGTFYKNIYNLDQKEFQEKLDEEEIDDPAFEVDADEDVDEDEDDSVLAEEEARLLEMAELEDQEEADEIENLDQKKLLSKRRKAVTVKREDEPEIEYEIEQEELAGSRSKSMLKNEAQAISSGGSGGGKKRRVK